MALRRVLVRYETSTRLFYTIKQESNRKKNCFFKQMSAECAHIYKSSALARRRMGTFCKINSTKINRLNRQKRAIAADPLCDWRAIFLSNSFNH